MQEEEVTDLVCWAPFSFALLRSCYSANSFFSFCSVCVCLFFCFNLPLSSPEFFVWFPLFFVVLRLFSSFFPFFVFFSVFSVLVMKNRGPSSLLFFSSSHARSPVLWVFPMCFACVPLPSWFSLSLPASPFFVSGSRPLFPMVLISVSSSCGFFLWDRVWEESFWSVLFNWGSVSSPSFSSGFFLPVSSVLPPFFVRPFSGFYKAREGLGSLPPAMAGIVEASDHGWHRGYRGRDLLDFSVELVFVRTKRNDEQCFPKRRRCVLGMTVFQFGP